MTDNPGDEGITHHILNSRTLAKIPFFHIQKGVCKKNDYQRLRSAGFVYSTGQPNTQPLYRCYAEAEHSHFAPNREGCNNMSKREALLGYDLKQ